MTPINMLIPVVCLFSVLGAYAMNNSIIDVFISLLFGLAAIIL